MTSRKKIPIVVIHWLDADAESGWSEYDEIEDQRIHYMQTVGLLVSKGKNFVVHADTYNPWGNQWSGKGKIPRSWVKKIETLGWWVYDEKTGSKTKS